MMMKREKKKTARDCSAHCSFLTLCTLPKPAALQRYLSSWRLELWARVAIANPCTLHHPGPSLPSLSKNPTRATNHDHPQLSNHLFSNAPAAHAAPGGLAEVLPSNFPALGVGAKQSCM